MDVPYVPPLEVIVGWQPRFDCSQLITTWDSSIQAFLIVALSHAYVREPPNRSPAEPPPAVAKCLSASDRWFFALAGAKSRTTRDGTSPCSRRLKIWLIEDRGCSSISALTLPPTAKARASAISWRVPTNEPRMVMQFATTSKRGTGNSPGGSPTNTQVPSFRVMPTPCLNAMSEGAVIRTP